MVVLHREYPAVALLATMGLLWSASVSSVKGQASVEFFDDTFTVEEGDHFNIRLERSGSIEDEFVVIVQVENDVEGDIVGTTQVTTFEPGGSSLKAVSFTVNDDDIPEEIEVFYFRLYLLDPRVKTGRKQRLFINVEANDDAFGVFTFGQPSPVITEEKPYTSILSIKIKREVATFGVIDVSFLVNSTSDDGVLGEDLYPVSGLVNFQPNQQEADLQLQIRPDELPENDEGFFVMLTSATNNAKVDKTPIQVIIKANDAAIRFSKAQYRFEEGPSSKNEVVMITRGLAADGETRIGPIDGEVTLDYFFKENLAMPVEDFIGSRGMLTFLPGETSKLVKFLIVDDAIPEREEDFSIRMFNIMGDAVWTEPKTAQVIINANDNPSGILSVRPGQDGGIPTFQVNEDSFATLDIYVDRSDGTFGDVRVNWFIIRERGSSPVEEDIGPAAGTLFFADGVNEAKISLTVVQDNDPEAAEMLLVRLDSTSVTGKAKVEGIGEARVLLEDSDNVYGTVEFGPGSDHGVDTMATPRLLRLSLTRSGARLDDLDVNISVSYDDGTHELDNYNVFEEPDQAIIMPSGQDPVEVEFKLMPSTFLVVGGEFTANITGIGFVDALVYGAFNSPKFGPRQSVSVLVSAAEANGETGFFNISNVEIDEPESGITEIILLVSREGLSGTATVGWSISGNSVTSDDVVALSGTVTLETGTSETYLTVGIKADDIPEIAELLIVTLDSIQPSDNQRLRPGSNRLVITVHSNDNPGGIISFSPEMKSNYQVVEGLMPIEVIVTRSGGALEERSVKYAMVPDGEDEFFGATNVLFFPPGQRIARATILAKKDGTPELLEKYSLVLTSVGDPPATLAGTTSIPVEIEENDDPNGIIRFENDPTVVYTAEGLSGQQINITVKVLREMGTFGPVEVPWSVQPSIQDDLIPSSGVLVFEDGQAEGILSFIVVNDEIPEEDETYAIQLQAPTGRATPGIPMVATIVILENDNPVEFREPLVYTTEPSIITLTVVRSGKLDSQARLFYRSLDGSASSVDGDYTQINTQELVFAVDEKEKTIEVVILDDSIPEGNETFNVQLFDVGGDMITTDSSTAIIVIKSNDDAYGVFSFAPPAGLEVEEGSVGFLDIIRDKGNFGSVNVSWEIRTLNNIPLPPGEDFESPTGQVTFAPQENKQALSVSPLADRKPERAERFLLVLTKVQGLMSTSLASISDQFVVATITVSSSDDPFGHMAFSKDARELKVAEDFNPGDEASTQATFVVERRQGTQDTVKVLWEVFSEELGGNLPVIYDFLFSSSWPTPMKDEVSKRRPGTATPVLLFSGAAGQFATVFPSANPVMATLARGFSLSAWVQPLSNTNGYIVARCTDDGNTHYYSLRLATSVSSTTLTLSLSSDAQENDVSSVSVSSTTQDGRWHHVFVVVDNTTVSFFLDGEKVGTGSRVESPFLDGPNSLVVGARPPGVDLFNGYMQDVRVYVRAMDDSAVKEIYSSSPFKDITQISGTLTYDERVTSKTFTIGSKQDIEEEGREVFNVKLLTTTGGATLSTTDSHTTLSVLKSDNANGLYAFVDKCSPARTQTESIEFTCVVDRLRGDDGSVSVSWLVQQRFGSVLEEAVDDFEQTEGVIVFLRGERKKEFIVRSKEDTVPELDEIFEVQLVSAESDDGIEGSTTTSGASIDESQATSQIVIEQNDYPYGLLQFSSALNTIPAPGVIISPVDGPVKVTVGEETGSVTLVVQRAQGTLREIRAEWRTRDLTALSEGKTPPDYVGAVGSIVMEDGVNHAFVNVVLKDNAIPEAEKTFQVELLNPTGGVELGPGAKVEVTIEASDAAFGVFQFADSQLELIVIEDRDASFTLQVDRLGGSIDLVDVSWEIEEESEDGYDIVEQNGVVTFQPGQTSQLIHLHIRDDTLPELDETIRVRLLGASKGDLGDPLKASARVVILANDDPYGRFIITDTFRPIRVLERDQDVAVTIQRMNGVYGSVDVGFRTLSASESLPYLPGPVSKAQASDFSAKEGKISFVDDQEFAEFFIPIIDDTDPERDESIFIILTDVTLVRGLQLRKIINSPRLGMASQTYAQIIISNNDDANGRLTLSPVTLDIEESNPIPQVELVRSGGAFGEVSVAFQVVDGTAKLNLDYVVLSPVIILGPEETRKRVPVEVIDDRVPELSEDFTIQLIGSISGGAVLGDNISAVVNILPSDDPNGLFEFVTREQTVEEGEQVYSVEITVSRTGGSIDVVKVEWQATLNGVLASDDISPSSGSLLFVTNEASHKIKISILPDTIPEGSEAIVIRLMSASNGGKIGERNAHVLTIAPNDSPHGLVAFSSSFFNVQEDGGPASQSVEITRSEGDYGPLRVFYTTSVMTIVDLMSNNNENVLSLYKDFLSGEPPEEGNLVNVTQSADTVDACASACTLTSSCASFMHLTTEDDSIVCSWFDKMFSADQLITTSSEANYYVKDESQVQAKLMNIANSGEDFSSVQGQSIVLEDGQIKANIPLTIIDDDLPELNEMFYLELIKVEVADIQYETEDEPKLGEVVNAIVSIDVNDNAFGVFSISSTQAVGNTVSVEEADRKAVDFVVTREGGSIGSVTIDWAVSAEERTAVYNQDFIADGATLVFDIGQTQRVISITLLDDDVPEIDKELTVVLRNPTSGATIGSPDSIRVVILANDYVAGVLSFHTSAILVKEGDKFELKVKRSLPALGVVKVDWRLKGLNGLKPEESFLSQSGSLEFLETEVEKTIQLEVLPDEKPEVNEEFTLILENIVTEGIGPTGAAIVDPQAAEVLITIASSDDPHGVFQFASNSLQLKVEENVGKASLSVDRKFGAIGNVKVSFEVTQGSVASLPSRMDQASSGQDFVAVASGFINIPDGQSSGNIDITIIDDSIPEISEIFVVRLTDVALTDIADPDLPPKLTDNGTEAEIIINANDGAQGIIHFAQDSVRVTTNEMGQDISLTVIRDNGTFDTVSVFYFSQAISESVQEGLDFSLTPGDLEFKEGESRKSIVISITDDTLPEPSETFEVILASPRNGALLGDDIRATITILANDLPGGIISFEKSDMITLTEDAEGTKASVTVSRGPGNFGDIQVPFIITNSLGQPTDDVLPKSGIIFFADRQTSAVLEFEAIDDDIPETEEVFTLILQPPIGQSRLGNIKTRTITILQNDSPFGLLQIFTLEDRLSKYTVEEKEQMLKFEVVRSQGTRGRISVDVVTTPGSAMASRDSNRVVLAPMDNAPSASTIGWHQVSVGSNTFMVVLTSLPSSSQLASLRPSLSSAGTGQSSMYKWQGQLSLLRTFSSDGASAATSFVIDDKTYLVVANGGREGNRQVSSILYHVTEEGDMEVVQGLETSGASDVQFFTFKSHPFLMVINSRDSNSNSNIDSHLYTWDTDNARFVSAPWQLIPTLYAKAVTSFTIDDQVYVVIANYYNRVTASYEINSAVYRMESDSNLVQHQQLRTQGAIDVTSLEVGDTTHLVIANNRQDVIAVPQDSVVYRWDYLTRSFILHQTLPTKRVRSVRALKMDSGSALLIFANGVGSSEIFKWDVETGRYKSVWQGAPFLSLVPMTIQQTDSSLYLMGSAEIDRQGDTNLFQLAEVADDSDFVPRRVTMTFEPGQTRLEASIVISTDETPEDTEQFSVTLTSPTNGAELGEKRSVDVEILSNDDAHGVVEFAQDSLKVTAEERENEDTTVILNVQRKLGFFGRIRVAWQASGDHSGVGDITPLAGQVEFANGQSVATISVSVRDDLEAEFAEVTYIRLTEVVETGSDLDAKGARLGTNVESMLTVLANDSPYGVLMWEKSSVTVQEPEESDQTVELTILRKQGLEKAIRVTYVTSTAYSVPVMQRAGSGEDYVSVQGAVDMTEDQDKALVSIVIKQDDLPEAAESFQVNLTSATLQGEQARPGSGPSIGIEGSVVEVTIVENDNARGIVEIEAVTNIEGRLDVYEEYGKNITVEIPLRRLVGFFGSVTVSWQAKFIEADILDFYPTGGAIVFNDQEQTSAITITIIDDKVPEPMETFDVELISVDGGAGLGSTTSVRVAILENDSPTGFFKFTTLEVETHESLTSDDPNGQATIVIQRLHGVEGLVNVRWRLNAEAENDFLPPLQDTVQFSQDEVQKSIVLQTKPDTILEGRESFVVSLVAATNKGDISQTASDCTVIILPDPGSSGIISVMPEFRQVMIGEPGESDPSYTGQAVVELTRGTGVFGEVDVTWSLTPRDFSAFVQVQGTVRFDDLQETTPIILQARDDSTPELKKTFSLQITSATGGAAISTTSSEFESTVLFAASDYPHGLIQFSSPEIISVSEDASTISLKVERTKGIVGQLLVEYTTSPGTATSRDDYLPSAGFLTFVSGVTEQTVDIRIVPDDLAEGPEKFYVNLTSVERVNDENDYTVSQGLSKDMRPALGPLSVKTVTISKNDDAEGFIQFNSTAEHMSVKEEMKVAKIPVVRLTGSYGDVSVKYVTEGMTAVEDDDYMAASGTLTLEDSQTEGVISITIKDDTVMESPETFKIILSDVSGGAQLGSITTSTVTILKSDYPNGRFSFQGQPLVTLPNPEKATRQVLFIERSAGVLGVQQVFWRIMGPNNPNLQLEDTSDISNTVMTNGQEVTSGSLRWSDGEAGAKELSLTIKPYTSWEVEKTFVVEMFKVVGSSNLGDGEIDDKEGQVRIKILRFGEPNGIIRFTGAATDSRLVQEPDGSAPTSIAFPVTRRAGTGVTGNIQIYWKVEGDDVSASDVSPMEGMVILEEGSRNGQITLQILPDKEPELTEMLSVKLVRVEGGAQIDTQLSQSFISIEYNDFPHGEFGILEEYQTVKVDQSDLSRFVHLNFTRFQGGFGSVMLTFTIKYDSDSSAATLESNSGTVTFNSNEMEALTRIAIVGNNFISMDSTFTVAITEVQYLGQVTQAPRVRNEYSSAEIVVPSHAANSFISFSNDLATVDEETKSVTVTLRRIGSYGAVSVDWISGYAVDDLPVGFRNGEMTPATGSVSMAHGQVEDVITVSVSPQVSQPESFVLRLFRAPQSFVNGGARLAPTNLVVRIDPYGMVRFADDSLTPIVSELDGKVVLDVWRLYGSQGRIAVYYSTQSDSADKQEDFEAITNKALTLEDGKTRGTFEIEINQDKIPEQNEKFYVSLLTVERFPTPVEPVSTPRISSLHFKSDVTIRESDDVYGVFSLTPTYTDVNEIFSTVTLTITRSGGLFGTVSVLVRTVGGGEEWTNQIVPRTDGGTNDTIADVIGQRNPQITATMGEDYTVLDTVVEFKESEYEKTVTVQILEDVIPEGPETILVYLTRPEGGARIAEGSSDAGKKGFAVITVASSDNSNGIIGFAQNSLSVQIEEDETPTFNLKLLRVNAFIGDVTVSWKAKLNATSSETADEKLREQLIEIKGDTSCSAGQSLCDLTIRLKPDEDPELGFTFIVLLTGAVTDAKISDLTKIATVEILPSDDVRGLIGFSPDSRVVIAGENDESVRLSVSRTKGDDYLVTVVFNTHQMPNVVTESGVKMYLALNSQDFEDGSGTLVFRDSADPNAKNTQFIKVLLTPDKASDEPLPKQFEVKLSSATNGARIDPDADTALVRIVKDSDVAISNIINTQGEDIYSDDGKVLNLVNNLDDIVQGGLSDYELNLTEDVLSKINQEGNKRRLSDGLIEGTRNLYCKLLDSKSDSRKGRTSLADKMDSFAYILLKNTPCPPAVSKDLESTECSNVKISAGRWTPEKLAGHEFNAQSDNTFTAPEKFQNTDPNLDGTNDQCMDFHFIEYSSTIWFERGSVLLMNDKVVSFGLKNTASARTSSPVKYRIPTSNNKVAAKGAKCGYFDTGSEKWVSSSDVCKVANNLKKEKDKFVDCECSHMSNYAVLDSKSSDDDTLIGYVAWFYVVVFVALAFFYTRLCRAKNNKTFILIAVIVHHFCFTHASFSASLHMHFLMSIFFTLMCLILDTFLSSDHSLLAEEDEDNTDCTVMGLFAHYFFLCQFTWIVAQSINFWKILIMNDEHSNRFYCIFFTIGWGLPLVMVAMFFAVTFNIFKYHTDISEDFIYDRVSDDTEICFISNGYAALGGILAPVLVCLLISGVVFVKAYQLVPQWQSYDDVYRGRYNAREIPYLLLLWALLCMSMLWLALHMIYGKLWMMIIFCIIELLMALLILVLYAIVRNPYFAFLFGPVKSSYTVSNDGPYPPIHETQYNPHTPIASVKGSQTSILNDAWEKSTDKEYGQMTVRRALPSQVYINPPVAVISPSNTIDGDTNSLDFDDLIYALKMGRSLSPSELSRSLDDDLSQLSVPLDRYETKRINIADTHL